ncbi:hypothetical protein K8R03_01470 [Candidatus Kaiserbacteria bacterium]|nr:hypothetical protein [Candidatus Kaiserbacteria bacterium]
MKGGGFDKKNNKPHFDKPQSHQARPIRMASRAGQFGKSRRSIPRSK